jgi:two-component system, response regulator PdtaR
VQRKVLIVDDEVLLVRTLSRAFREEGYTVVPAGSAEEAAVAYQASAPFDLLLLDNRLPGKSGLDFLEGLGALPETRVVLMTAYDTEETHRRSTRLGVDLYLRKPFDLASLLSQAGELLEKGAET